MTTPSETMPQTPEEWIELLKTDTPSFNECIKQWRQDHPDEPLNLSNQSIMGGEIKNADLAGVNLSGTYFETIGIQNVNFKGANLEGTRFWITDFSGTHFDGANLKKAEFKMTRHYWTSFRKLIALR